MVKRWLSQWLVGMLRPGLEAVYVDAVEEELNAYTDMLEHKLESKFRAVADRTSGHIQLRVGQKQVLLDTHQPGFIGGVINCVMVAGPNEAEISVDLYTPIPGHTDTPDIPTEPFEFSKALVHRREGQPFSPIIVVDDVYAPCGGRITLKHANGLETPYYYDLYRR